MGCNVGDAPKDYVIHCTNSNVCMSMNHLHIQIYKVHNMSCVQTVKNVRNDVHYNFQRAYWYRHLNQTAQNCVANSTNIELHFQIMLVLLHFSRQKNSRVKILSWCRTRLRVYSHADRFAQLYLSFRLNVNVSMLICWRLAGVTFTMFTLLQHVCTGDVLVASFCYKWSSTKVLIHFSKKSQRLCQPWSRARINFTTKKDQKCIKSRECQRKQVGKDAF